ncbi:MAG: response regulator [Deltaproteobacteria bacterium]|nr:response regulator [Deltaproteobacteria bacterium]
MKILVIDDSGFSRKALINQIPEDVLNDAQIIQGSDGQQAVDLYKENRPNVVFLDLTMPKKSGYEALEEIIEFDRDAYVIVVTADIQRQAQARVTQMGARGIEAKPLKGKRLEEIFNDVEEYRTAIPESDEMGGIYLTEELIDALSELINISFGSATAMIADLFDSFATLRVPNIKIIPVPEIETVIFDGNTHSDLYVTTQQFRGNFSGEVVFIMDKQSAHNVHRVVYDTRNKTRYEASRESVSEQDILEISNILGSSCISKFVSLLRESVMFSPPVIELLDQLLVGLKNSKFSKVIVIGTILEFKDIEIHGKLFIMFSDEMFSAIEKALKTFLEEL